MSISGVSGSSSTSGIFAGKNIFTGMASGLDTEAIIENSVAGFKTKIQSLIQKQTKLTWKQDAFRSITDQLVGLSSKYTSYTSKTNLMSNSFFNSSVINEVKGTNASKVSASGKSTSDIELKSVDQLASAARYTIDAAALNLKDVANTTGGAIKWDDKVDVSKISGSMTVTYGNRTFDISFAEDEVYNSAEELADAIRSKLGEQNMVLNNQDVVKASERIGVNVDGSGNISFSDLGNAGNSVYVSSASGDLKTTLGIETGSEKGKSFSVDSSKLKEQKSMADYLSGQSLEVTLDGTTKTVKIGELATTKKDADGKDVALTAEEMQKQLADKIQEGLDKSFGSDRIKVSTKDGGLDFSIPNSSSRLSVTSSAGEKLGIGKDGLSNYLNTNRTLGDLMGEDYFVKHGEKLVSEKYSYNEDTKKWTDSEGNLVNEKGVRLGKDGKELYGADLVINGVKVGTYTRDSELTGVMSNINSNTEAGVSVGYSKLTNQFVFNSRETGSGSTINFADGLAADLFTAEEKVMVQELDPDGKPVFNEDGSPSMVEETDADGKPITKPAGTYTEGTDAELTVLVNGQEINLVRDSNTVDLDGLKVVLKDTFSSVDEKTGKPIEGYENVTFSTKADSDKIVDAIKTFVEDFNKVATEIHDAYSTMPAEKNSSTHARYEPLTDEDKEDMSESAIEKHEEKAKQGILFGDSDLSRLYSKLLTVMSPTGDDRKACEKIGLTTEYSNGVTTLSLDEEKLRAALESDPDGVRDVFTKSKEYGSKSDGLMTNLKNVLDAYASTSIATPGILVSKAGTKLSSISLMNNSLQDQIGDLDDQIDKWQAKMSTKVDYYINQFTKLEQLMNEFNSQSSAFAGLMGAQ